MSIKVPLLRRLAFEIVLSGFLVLSLMPAASRAEVVAIDGENSVRGPTSLVLDSAGNPRISYSDEDDYSVKLLICDDPGCDASSSHIVFAHGFEN